MTDGQPVPPAGSSNVPAAPIETQVAELREEVAGLVRMLQNAARDAAAANAAALPPVVTAPPPPPPPVAGAGTMNPGQFVAPIAPLGSPAGASLSLRSLFPDIKPACITAVITHELEASDLYKLDVRVKDSNATYSFSASGALEMDMSKHKSYKNFNSIALPLHTYFAILTAHLPSRTAATVYFYRYLSHLTTLVTEYEWPAVLEYHTLFFNRRRNDMLTGSYEGWATSDIGLLSSYVYPHRKVPNVTSKSSKKATSPATEPCRKFNAGTCSSPCAWKRPHICSSPGCGKEHPLTEHK
jgi:hypothetical protein